MKKRVLKVVELTLTAAAAAAIAIVAMKFGVEFADGMGEEKPDADPA